MVTSENLFTLFIQTRKRSEEICSYLETEDYVVQPIVDVSPPKWHLGHTTWFFEEFILKNHLPGYKLFDEQFAFVFNSYYETVGSRVIRTDRGNLSRPTVEQIYAYRKYVTTAMKEFFQNGKLEEEIKEIVELGVHHEKQHQELLLTDIKYILGNNPLFPKYNEDFEEDPIQGFSQEWISMEEGIYGIGHSAPDEFCFDNELAHHKVFLPQYKISNALITNGEYLDFMKDGGYKQVLLWHSEGWDWVNGNNVRVPMYWYKIDGEWQHYTLGGIAPVNPDAPLTHISYYEAFAFSQWKGKRLPSEFEWEAAQEKFSWGTRWEWTESSYSPYPHFKKAPGALGEYNGKFMVNQKVLRGGSVATAPDHIRHTYRNFFHPHLRWQFTGLRLAE